MDSGHTLSFTAAAQRLVKVADALVFCFWIFLFIEGLLLEEFGLAFLGSLFQKKKVNFPWLC